MGAVGDSITAHSASITIQLADASPAARGFYFDYGLILPPTGESLGGGLIWGGLSATVGHRIQDVVDTHLPAMLATTPKIGMCSVLIGANDGADFETPALLAAHVANMAYIYDTLLANDIFPIACGLPTSDGGWRAGFQLFNAELETLAAARNIPYVDMFTVTDNGVDGWLPGYSADGIHPNSVGARAMGQEWRDTLDPWLLSPPQLVTVATEEASNLLWTNGTQQDDGDADGDPDGGEVQTVNCWQRFSGGADCNFTLEAEPGVVEGNWWNIEKVANTAATVLLTIGGNPCPNIPEGHQIAYGFKCKIVSADPATTIMVWGEQIDDGTNTPFRVKLLDLQAALDPFDFYIARVKEDLTELRLKIEISGGLADFYIGQVTVRDLSA
ncbi:MAG TPA: SGNH/GDSL hydrolase family protein [Anaerolineales bacterium]|nr:SGNH/GDSL hydrolase family protein [Anaerolineales bacterium]